MKTLIGKTLFLKDIFQHDFWFILGGPSSWEDENLPPSINNLTTEITDPLICIKANKKNYVKIDSNGTLKYGGMKLKPINETDIFNSLFYPDYIYLEIEMDDTLLNENTYWRQTGVSCDLIKDPSIIDDRTILYPDLNEISDFGYLISYENHKAKTILPGQSRKIITLIEI